MHVIWLLMKLLRDHNNTGSYIYIYADLDG